MNTEVLSFCSSLERKLLVFISLISAAIAISCVVLLFRMQDASDADRLRAQINRYLICHVLLEMQAEQTLCADIDPPVSKRK